MRRRLHKILTQGSFPSTPPRRSLFTSSESNGRVTKATQACPLSSPTTLPDSHRPLWLPCSLSSTSRCCLQAQHLLLPPLECFLPKSPHHSPVPCPLQIFAFLVRTSPPISSKISPLPALPHPLVFSFSIAFILF